MYKLMSANLSRLFINRAFWLAVMLMICAEGFFCLVMLRYGTVPMDVVLFVSLQCISVLTAVFLS